MRPHPSTWPFGAFRSRAGGPRGTIEERPRAQVLWITNFAAPYRLPVWRALSRQVALTVALVVDAKNFHLDGANRGNEWSPTAQATETFPLETLRTSRIPRIARPIHFLHARKEWKRFHSRGSVLLGGWEEPVYWQALFLAKIKGARTVGFYESISQSQTYRRGIIAGARRLFFRSLDAVVVPGVAAASAIEAMGVPQERIFRGFNAVDVAVFHEARRRTVRSAEEEGHRFVFVGRLIELKNIPAIITAFARIAFDGDTLTIIGSGEQKADLLRQVNDLGLDNRVLFHGPVNYLELPDLLAQFDTLVLASRTEVWGLVVNEALAAGLHCVVGRRCGVAASVENMRGVFVCDIDVDGLAAHMSASRGEWNGPIATPEILDKTPEAFALTFAEALRRDEGAEPDE